MRKHKFRRQLSHLCSFQTDFFQIWYDDRDHKALHIDISLDDFDLHSRSQLCGTSKTLVFTFLCANIVTYLNALLKPILIFV